MRILFIVYDNGSYIPTFPIGIGYLTSVLEKAGHRVDIYQQDVNHWPLEHLTGYLTKYKYDAIGLSFIGGYWQYRKAKEIASVIDAIPERLRPLWVDTGYDE